MLPQNPGQEAKYGNLEKRQRTYLPEQYPEGKPQPTDLAIGLALEVNRIHAPRDL